MAVIYNPNLVLDVKGAGPLISLSASWQGSSVASVCISLYIVPSVSL